MMATLYPEVLKEVEAVCKQYRQKLAGLDDLKRALWKAASTITASEERELREFLQGAEGQLDAIQFTTDESLIFERAVGLIAQVEARLEACR